MRRPPAGADRRGALRGTTKHVRASGITAAGPAATPRPTPLEHCAARQRAPLKRTRRATDAEHANIRLAERARPGGVTMTREAYEARELRAARGSKIARQSASLGGMVRPGRGYPRRRARLRGGP
jgi:hypothetical protein